MEQTQRHHRQTLTTKRMGHNPQNLRNHPQRQRKKQLRRTQSPTRISKEKIHHKNQPPTQPRLLPKSRTKTRNIRNTLNTITHFPIPKNQKDLAK